MTRLALALTAAMLFRTDCPPAEFRGIKCPAGYTESWSVGADNNCRLTCVPVGGI